uniref:Uncharacterized protein n=1 Tax=Photinus pyralis TaxID=7054 RepID=A0A1Y1MS96_PHOPY
MAKNESLSMRLSRMTTALPQQPRLSTVCGTPSEASFVLQLLEVPTTSTCALVPVSSILAVPLVPLSRTLPMSLVLPDTSMPSSSLPDLVVILSAWPPSEPTLFPLSKMPVSPLVTA